MSHADSIESLDLNPFVVMPRDSNGINGTKALALDAVLIASIKTKVHAIGPGVIAGLLKGIELAEASYRGLVIWSADEPFSYGADLQAMLPLFMSGGVKAIEPEEKKLQDAMLRLRYAAVPTVAAVAGMALGGGCELALHTARRVAHLESYIGLVEVGVGLVPGGGGLAYGARRAASACGCACITMGGFSCSPEGGKGPVDANGARRDQARGGKSRNEFVGCAVAVLRAWLARI